MMTENRFFKISREEPIYYAEDKVLDAMSFEYTLFANLSTNKPLSDQIYLAKARIFRSNDDLDRETAIPMTDLCGDDHMLFKSETVISGGMHRVRRIFFDQTPKSPKFTFLQHDYKFMYIIAPMLRTQKS